MDHSIPAGAVTSFQPAYVRALKIWHLLAGSVMVAIWVEAYFTDTLTAYLAWAAPIFGPGFFATAAYVHFLPRDAARAAMIGFGFFAGYFMLAYVFALIEGPWEYSYLIFSNAVWASTIYLYGSLFLGRLAFRINFFNAAVTSVFTVACAVRFLMSDFPKREEQFGLQPYFYSLLAQWAMLIGAQVINELYRAVRSSERQVAFLRQVVAEMVGHEIGTPLQSILNNLGLLHLLIRRIPGADRSADILVKTDRAIGNLQRSVEQIERVLSNAANSSQTSVEGIPAARMEEVDIHQLLDSLIEDHRARAAVLNLKMSLDRSGPRPGRVITDRTRLTQITTNLMTNALKYTDEGEVVLRCTSPRRNELELTVTDTGIGMPPEALDAIFEPYVRLPDALKRATPGSGLGLAVVKRELAVLKGHIAVQSVHGKGSTFVATIPAVVSCFSPRLDATTLRILVVDDSPDVLAAAAELLDGQGWTCHTAADGGQALAMLAAQAYDLVFLDIQMPVADGCLVARKIRSDKALKGNADVPIVGMSASAPTEAEASVFNFFLKKPFGFSPDLVRGFVCDAVR